MPVQVIGFMLKELDADEFYIVCPGNDIDREIDNLRYATSFQMAPLLER
jgi:hypothetical protein